MARYSRIFRMFIASPSEKNDYRRVVYEAAYRWNAVHSVSAEVAVEPVGWEWHVRPEGNAKGGQDSIDTQLLLNSDFLIAVFHSRVGGSVRGGVSGTIHEIERFVELGKPTMVFFSRDEFDYDIDPDELKELREFKKNCQKRNLYADFGNDITLQSDVMSAISQHIDVLKPDFSLKIDAFQGLRSSAPPGGQPRKFRFPKELMADEVKFSVCFFEPEFDLRKDPDNEWNFVHQLELNTWEVDRQVLFREAKGNWHYSFKFHIEVPYEKKNDYLIMLLEHGLVLTGDGESVSKDKWRIWFLHDEAPVHPHYTGTCFLNQCLFRLPISV